MKARRRFGHMFPLEYKGIISLEVYPKNKNEKEDEFLAEAYESITNNKLLQFSWLLSRFLLARRDAPA